MSRARYSALTRHAIATDNVPVSLWHPMWQSVSRWNMYAQRPVGPAQAISRERALRAMTNDGAYLTMDEGRKGSIEPGKLADLAVLSADPLTVAEPALKEIEAVRTIVGGKTVFERAD